MRRTTTATSTTDWTRAVTGSAVFVDTGAWIGLFNKTDQNHEAACTRLARLTQDRRSLVSSEYVLVETYTFLMRRCGYALACAAHERFGRLAHAGVLDIVLITPEIFDASWLVFERFNRDHHWSFTDCASKVVMEQLGISEAFAFDEHFTQMGFQLIA